MAAVLAAASCSRGGFSLYLVGSARRVIVPGGSTFHLEPGKLRYSEVGVVSFPLLLDCFNIDIQDLVLPSIFISCHLYHRNQIHISPSRSVTGGGLLLSCVQNLSGILGKIRCF